MCTVRNRVRRLRTLVQSYTQAMRAPWTPIDSLALAALRSLATIVRALPPRAIVALGRGLGVLSSVVDRRGRRVGLQNLDVAFGERLTPAEKQRLLRHAYEHLVRGLLVGLHASPFGPERVRRWIDVPADVERRVAELVAAEHRGVVISGHFGSWELLLGLPALLPVLPPVSFLIQPLGNRAVDRFFEELRTSAHTQSTPRRGGARFLIRHIEGGGVAGVLADRNVRPTEGGVWAPLFGLPAATATLPARLARRLDVPVIPVFCTPVDHGRYRLDVGCDLAEGLPRDDPDAHDHAFAVRWNQVLESRIRAQPEAWNWTFMRFKSRPERELGRYPPYSGWRGPDPWTDSPLARPRQR